MAAYLSFYIALKSSNKANMDRHPIERDKNMEKNIIIGERIKYYRIKNNLTLEDLSKISGISIAYLSQIENSKQINPSVDTLKKIADSMKLALMSFFEDSDQTDRLVNKKAETDRDTDPGVAVVRKNERKTMSYPKSDWEIELLSPDLKRKIEFIMTIAKPNQTSGSGWLQHEGEECGIVIQGKLKFIVGNNEFILEEGDSIYLNSDTPHRWEVIGDKISTTIWAITPPSF